MAGYIILDVKTKKVAAICSAITLLGFVIGILIGFFSAKSSSEVKEVCSSPLCASFRTCISELNHSPGSKLYYSRYVERNMKKNACAQDAKGCMELNLPRHYIAYHLNGKSIVLDGKLDDQAWEEVPWTETFVDMRSEVYPDPYLDTKVKVRWDNERLYIGAYIEETNLWATYDEHDSNVFEENGFEVLMDVDGTMFNYKQAQINVLGTMLDLLLYKSPYDNGSREVAWHPDARKGVYYEGTINNPADTDKFWSVEMSFSFRALFDNSESNQDSPVDNDVWFMQFGRSEQKLNVTAKGKYERIPNSKTDWWSWQPCDAINLHLQDRWGLVQFKRSLGDRNFDFEKWHVYRALFDTMDAIKLYRTKHGRYTDQVEELDAPPYLFSNVCVEIPEIRLINQTDFTVTIRSKISDLKPGHIRSDRYVTFN